MTDDDYTPRTMIVTMTTELYRDPVSTDPGNERAEVTASRVLAPDDDPHIVEAALVRDVARMRIGGDL